MTAGDPVASVANLGTGRGTVTSWDDDRGWGEVTADDGRAYPLHCTGIANGSRTIATGTEVSFHLAAGRMGRWEAWAVAQPLTQGPS